MAIMMPSGMISGKSHTVRYQKLQPWQDSVVFTSNNTAVHEVFDRCIKVWDSVYKSRAYVFGP